MGEIQAPESCDQCLVVWARAAGRGPHGRYNSSFRPQGPLTNSHIAAISLFHSIDMIWTTRAVLVLAPSSFCGSSGGVRVLGAGFCSEIPSASNF